MFRLTIIERLPGFYLDTNLFVTRHAIFYQFNDCVYPEIILIIDPVKYASRRINHSFYEIDPQFRYDDFIGVIRHPVLLPFFPNNDYIVSVKQPLSSAR